MIDIREYLEKFNTRKNSEEENAYIKNEIIKNKEKFASLKDEDNAKLYWIYENTLFVQELYLKAYEEIKNYKYYDGWCTLERCEIELKALLKHSNQNQKEMFWLEFISEHVFRYQSIYPYKVFMSPELIEKKIVCSICGNPINIRNHCGHEAGEIYNGNLCTRIIEDGELIGIALVENPVQKYSVLFLTGENGEKEKDHYNYQVVKYLIDALSSPFDEWKVNQINKLHSHSNFRDYGRNEKCPCGSGKKYKNCCLLKSGVLMPHFDFVFSKEPPKGFEKLKFI